MREEDVLKLLERESNLLRNIPSHANQTIQQVQISGNWFLIRCVRVFQYYGKDLIHTLIQWSSLSCADFRGKHVLRLQVNRCVCGGGGGGCLEGRIFT